MRRLPFLWTDPGYSQGMLHVIIPTLNAGTGLTRLLPALHKGGVAQIWVADGGSDDATLASAGHCGARILSCPPGRGRQLSAGAEAALQAGAGWLLFLHADSTLPEGWADLLTDHRLRFPGHAAAFADPALVRVAVNQDHAGLDAIVTDRDEVAFFPPVTGG